MAAADLNPAAHEYFHEDSTYTFNLDAAIVAGDVGKAVEIDATGDMKVKLATDGAIIFGRLETFENRVNEGLKVGTVCTKFMGRLPVKAAALLITRGNSVVGAGAGEVKGAAAAAGQNNTIVAATTPLVSVLFG